MANQTQKPKLTPAKQAIENGISNIPMKSLLIPRNLVIVGLFFTVLFFISPPFKLPWTSLKEGAIPREDILAEIDFKALDIEATRLAQEQAASIEPPVYALEPEIIQSSISDAKARFDKIAETLNPIFSEEERITLISKYLPGSTSDETFKILAGLNPEKLDTLRLASMRLIEETLNRGVLSDVPGSARRITIYQKSSGSRRVVNVDDTLTLKKAPEAISESARESFPDSPLNQHALQELSLPFIRSTLVFDEKLTEEAHEEARKRTPPVMKSFRKNQEIAQAGHEITKQDELELHEHAVALSKANRLQIYIGNTLILIMVFGCFFLYLGRFRPDVSKSNRALLLVSILVVLTLATARLFIFLDLPDVWLFLVPVAAGAILLSILVDDRVAFVYSFLISILYAAQGSYRLDLFLVGLFGSLAGIFHMRVIRRRSDIFWPGIMVAGANIFTIFALYLIGAMREDLVSAIIAGALNGLFTAIGIVPGSLIPLEGIFGIVTNIRLLELSDLNQPLLKRLAMQAPGTYHHSLMVGNMAEAAAESIGANTLMARVGSYYHDVGKMSKPLYFSENQREGKNKHDELTPSMSALVLMAHVKEGVEMARENRLSQPIVDFIQQHHGASLMPFFYEKAMEQDPSHSIDEDSFRYPGPKPQTRETAICMLADGVEAASRTLTNPTHGRIKAMVEKIINNKFIDAQLDECDLTLKDLLQISESFVRVLAGYLHSRVEYPEEQTAPEIKEKFESTDTKVNTKAGNKARSNPQGG